MLKRCISHFASNHGPHPRVALFVHVSGVEAACMRKKNRKPHCRKIVLRLPDLEHTKTAVLNSLSSPHSRRNYKYAMEQFITWYSSEPRLALNRAVVLRFRLYLESLGLAAGTVNQRLAAVRRLAYEAADSGRLVRRQGGRIPVNTAEQFVARQSAGRPWVSPLSKTLDRSRRLDCRQLMPNRQCTR